MPESWYTMRNQADKAIVDIYDEIGFCGVTAEDFKRSLSDIEAKTLEVHVNTPGGDVFDGVAIYNSLKDFDGRVEVVIDSLAASIGSVIAMAGDSVTIHETAMMMIHDPWMIAMGNSKYFRKEADLLDKIRDNQILPAYKNKAGDKWDEEKILNLMEEETWLSAAEAVELGLADEVIEEASPEDKAKPFAWSKGLYHYNVPEAVQKAIYNAARKATSIDRNSAPHGAGREDETFKQEKSNMPEKAKTQEAPAVDNSSQEPIVDIKAVQAAERQRVSRIHNLGKSIGAEEAAIQSAVDNGLSFDEAFDKLQESAKSHTPKAALPPRDIKVGAEDLEKYRNAAVHGILAAGDGIVIDKKESAKALTDGDVPKGIHSLIKAELRREGRISPNRIDNMSATDIADHGLRLIRNAASGASGDFDNILADTINKAVGVGFDESTSTWQPWVKVKPVRDYRDYSHVKTSTFSDMKKIEPGMPFEHGAISDKKETGSVSDYGAMYTISNQALVNDDLGELTTVPRKMGNSWNWYINKLVYDTLYGSSGTGPTMAEDSTALFDASTHRNYITDGAAPSVSTLAVGREALRNVTAPKGRQDQTAHRLNLVPRWLIVPSSLETTAEQVIATNFDISQSIAGVVNPFAAGGRTPLSIIVDAYLDSLDSSAWYLATEQNMMETIVLLALDGQVTPTIRSDNSRVGEALGISFDIRGAVGPMAAEWRGLFRNDGTAE